MEKNPGPRKALGFTLPKSVCAAAVAKFAVDKQAVCTAVVPQRVPMMAGVVTSASSVPLKLLEKPCALPIPLSVTVKGRPL
jgi:hypothetical protein